MSHVSVLCSMRPIRQQHFTICSTENLTSSLQELASTTSPTLLRGSTLTSVQATTRLAPNSWFRERTSSASSLKRAHGTSTQRIQSNRRFPPLTKRPSIFGNRVSRQRKTILDRQGQAPKSTACSTQLSRRRNPSPRGPDNHSAAVLRVGEPHPLSQSDRMETIRFAVATSSPQISAL